MDQYSVLESKLLSHVAEFTYRFLPVNWDLNYKQHCADLISMVCSMDLDSHPKPESKFMSLITQTFNVFNSMDLDSQPEPLSKLILYFSPEKSEMMRTRDIYKLLNEAARLEPKPELISLIQQIISLVISMKSKLKRIIPICPRGELFSQNGKLKVRRPMSEKRGCLLAFGEKFLFDGELSEMYLFYWASEGESHILYNSPSIEIKHSLHPKHSLQLFFFDIFDFYMGKQLSRCYCCARALEAFVYHCLACNLSINITCLRKQPNIYMDCPKWHEHTLALFPSQNTVICSVCALRHSSCPFYICPRCDFVVHQSCLCLPHLIRICRHQHLISFTHSFGQGNWCCGVCREKINNNYGGYSCIKDGCLYGAHSKCATQENVWDGKELMGLPKEIVEELEPFVKLSNGDIQHFSHPSDHHLRLDENTGREYDENKLCQACITPICFGNFYSCIKCDFILHQACAELPRKMYYPIHPHQLTLVAGVDKVMDRLKYECSVCPQVICLDGFFYQCKECYKCKLHVQCATISEPLLHKSHKHPLFLTSKPEEERRDCSVCKQPGYTKKETFNCIECNFSLCFECATIPNKVRYKHDKHKLILSYGEETSTMTYWCEVCEKKVNPKERFYTCDEYCCVTIHIECLVGIDLYMKPGSSWSGIKMLDNWKPGSARIQKMLGYVLPNNQNMSRPICSFCKNRCPYNIVFEWEGLITCSKHCLYSLF